MKYVASRIAWALLAAVVTTAAPSIAPAASIPPSVIEVQAQGGTPILTVGTVTGFQCLLGGCEFSTATASYNGSSAAVSGNGWTHGGAGTANSSGTAVVGSFFEVTGSALGVTSVPLIFTGSDTTAASGPDAEATGYFQTPGGDIDSCSATGLSVGHCGTLAGGPGTQNERRGAPRSPFCWANVGG